MHGASIHHLHIESYLQTNSRAIIPRESSRRCAPTRDGLSRVEVGPLLKRMILIDYLQQRSAGQLVGVIDRRLWKMTIFAMSTHRYSRVVGRWMSGFGRTSTPTLGGGLTIRSPSVFLTARVRSRLLWCNRTRAHPFSSPLTAQSICLVSLHLSRTGLYLHPAFGRPS